MTSIDNIQSSMKSLKIKETEKIKISDKINDLNLEKEILVKELPTLEEELSIWQIDLSNLEKNRQNAEELKVWADEIKNIELQIEKKKSQIKENSNYLEEKINNETSLKDEIKNLRLEIKNQIFDILRSNNLSKDYTKKEIILLTEILKTVLESYYKLEIDNFIQLISNEGVKISLNYLELINQLFGEKLVILPEVIPTFICDYLNDLKSGTILDPWPLNGFMSKSFLGNHNNDLVTVNTNSKILNTLIKTDSINPEEINEDYDFIVGYPPISQSTVIHEDLKKPIVDDTISINFLDMASKLKEDGEGIFLLEPDFLLERNPKSTFSNLENFGLYLKAIIEIPYTLVPSGTDKILVILSKNHHKDLFVGSLSHETDANKILKDNLILRRPGKIPQQGFITSIDKFFTFKSFYAYIDSITISKDLKLNTKPFSTIIEKFNFHLNGSEIKEEPNSLFLPFDENLKVVVDDAKIGNSNYIQLVLNPEYCMAEYLARYFNDTLLGHKIKESINLGKYTASVFDDLIVNTQIYLPDLDAQVEVLRVDSVINEISARANTYREQLWKTPNEYKLIIEEIESLDDKNEYRFEQWVESLPYPLSSILWESFSTSKADLKVKYLLHFFEAFSEFNVVIMLSGLISDERFFNREFYRCTQFNPKFRNWFNNPSFGNWNFLGQCLAKNLQYILKKQYKRNQVLNIFGTYNAQFLEKLSSYELYEILSEVNRYRNSWDAHGPVVSNAEYENRYKILRNSISKLYTCIGNIFKDNLLIMPQDSTYRDGIHSYNAKKFMGSRNRFITIELESITPMDSKDIYLIMDNNRKPIKLLPLLKYYENACYFYNSKVKDNDKNQFVSYHYKEKPQILCPSFELDEFYSIFEKDSYY
ncbi:hypothetical protein DSECCO2_272530 [anaerobic digester metagenome]|nr:hypothetical protein [Methanobacterium sp. YSL]